MPQSIFEVSTDWHDLFVVASGASYPPGGAPVYSSTQTEIFGPTREFGAGTYQVKNGLLLWDTSSLPDDATVTAATLRLKFSWVANPDSRSFTADWFAWGASAAADYSLNGDAAGFAAGTTAHSGTSLGSITVNADNDFALTNLSNISKTGNTYLRLHVSGGQPAGANQLTFYAQEHTTEPAARLIVDYTTVPPTRLIPYEIISQTNLTGTVSAIQDDPDSETGVWLTAP